MSPSEAKQLINSCIEKGWVKRGLRLYTPLEAKKLNIEADKPKRALKRTRTFDTADYLNIANKEKHRDTFTKLIELELKLEVWPEYRFAKEKGYKLDYALPEYKIGVEVQGGIWARGKSGHSSGKGISRDMDKLNLLSATGWQLIQVTPAQLISDYTINLIKNCIKSK